MPEPNDASDGDSAVEHNGADNASPHAIAYRISVPLIGGRYYFAFFAGNERRSPERIEAEAQRKPWTHTLFGFMALIGAMAMVLIGIGASLWLLKVMMAIEIFE